VTSERFEPTEFGRYSLVERMAVGGMAEIFKAKAHGAHGFEKTLVVKRILPHLAVDNEFVDMFIDEAKVMVQLAHPKIVQVLDFGEVEGQYYIAMEYVQGTDALALLRTCARLRCRPTTGIAVHIIADVLDALDYAHNLKDPSGRALNIVHRDISPSNVFISDLGEVKLGDFGIARAEMQHRHTETGALKGKYGYMSPEGVSGGSVDHRADLFSVGVVLAELLMVRRLFLAKSELEVLLQVRDARLDRMDKYGQHIQPELRSILAAALARDPANRYQDAGTFRDVLHRYLFDQKRMVRAADVRQFLQRLHELEAQAEVTPAARPLPPVPPRPTPDQPQPVAVLGEPSPPAVAALGEPWPQPPPDQRAVAALGEPSPAALPVPQPSRSADAPRPRETHGGGPAVDNLALLEEATRKLREAGQVLTEYSARTRERVRVDSKTGNEAVRAAVEPEHRTPWPTESASIGHRRKILLGPPPRPEPVPVGLPETGEQPRLPTDDMLQAITELQGDSASSAHDFRGRDSVPALEPPDPEDLVTPMEAAKVAATRVSLPLGDDPAEPFLRGDLAEQSLFKVLFRLAIAEETGLLAVRTERAVKEIYLVDGDPHYVTSNLPGELFGQYLVQRGVLSEGELSMALAVLPHFDGKLGSALVALRLLRPMQVLRHLTHQVRQKLLNAFELEEGTFVYYRGRRCEQESAPLGLDAYEVIGAGVMALPEATLTERVQPLLGQRLRTITPSLIPPEAFRLGGRPRQVFDALDARQTVSELLHRYDDLDHRESVVRIVYLLVETGLAAPA
jgi:serine/threonine protein kinase